MKLLTADELEFGKVQIGSSISFNFGNLYGIKYYTFPPCAFLALIINRYLEIQKNGLVLIQKVEYFNPLFLNSNLDKVFFFDSNKADNLTFNPSSLIIIFSSKVGEILRFKIRKLKAIGLMISKNIKGSKCTKVIQVATKFGINFKPKIVISTKGFEFKKLSIGGSKNPLNVCRN